MLRMYDIIVTNPGFESYGVTVTNMNNIYNASDLGSGYERSSNGTLTSSNNSVSFEMIFKTDVESTGYEKYLQTVTDMASGSMVWLRYAIPVHGEYQYAYRPGYVSSISKKEASYQAQSLVETVTITTVGGWFDICVFTGGEASKGFTYTPQRRKVFSNYPDNWKTQPMVYPYWYQSVMSDVRKSGSWYNRWGSVLQSKSDVYQLFAVHAPSMSISNDEYNALTVYEKPAKSVVVQTSRMKGPNFQAKVTDKTLVSKINDPKLEAKLRKNYNTIVGYRHNRKRGKMTAGSSIFKSGIKNFSLGDNSGPFDEYHSYQITGTSVAGGTLEFRATSTDIEISVLKFEKDGDFIIDTAPWANIYQCNGTSGNIDFSKFTKTTVSHKEKLVTTGVSFSRIVLRRELLAI